MNNLSHPRRTSVAFHRYKHVVNNFSMKVFAIIFVALASSHYAKAQFNQGRMLLGGAASFSSMTAKYKNTGSTDYDSKNTTLGFSPQFGYFVIDQLAIGINANLSYQKSSYTDSPETSSITSIQVGPFIRYYFANHIFLQGQFGIGPETIKDDFSGSSSTEKSTISTWSILAGYALFLNDHIAIEPAIGYQSSTTNPTNGVNSTQNGLAISIGFQIYLGE